MLTIEQIEELAQPSSSRIILLVIDGLGGLPRPETGKTELETARTPNLDLLAKEGICGLIDPVSTGVTPGSGPGHLALFGYDPLRFTIGRGILEALGVDFPLHDGDVAARGNFCTIDESGIVTDRRAGRISTEKCAELCQRMVGIKIKGAEILVSPVKEHRCVVVFRRENLCPALSDSDPQKIGLAPRSVEALSPEAEETAQLANEFLSEAGNILKSEHPANMVLLRGFSQHPHLPPMSEIYKLNPAAIATYPMYRGLARLAGMEILESGPSLSDELDTLSLHYHGTVPYDFFFIHVKATDSAGEDGDFNRKVSVIEEVDSHIPRLMELSPDVVMVTGDHSTPAMLKAHSWHPVPFLLRSQWCRPDSVTDFSESSCARGSMGRFPGVDIMPLAMANALKLSKFGA